jgi:hypothetical protein
MNIGGTTYFNKTHTAGGQCWVTFETDDTITFTCGDGPNWAAMNTGLRCAASSGSGSCGNVDDMSADSVNQLNCSDGTTYNLSSGVEGKNNCDAGTGGTKRCEESQGSNNFAVASCTTGCGASGGSGCCCKEGTANCALDVDCRADTPD